MSKFIILIAVTLAGARMTPATLLLGNPPKELSMLLIQTQDTLGFIENCGELHPRIERKLKLEKFYAQMSDRQRDNEMLASGLWGKLLNQTELAPETDPWGKCTTSKVERAVKVFDSASSRFEAQFGAVTGNLAEGSWIGPIRLCKSTVQKANLGYDKELDQPFAELLLHQSMWNDLQMVTERAVAMPLPIRLNGRIVSSPFVTEPIPGGLLRLSGATEAENQQLIAAAQGAC